MMLTPPNDGPHLIVTETSVSKLILLEILKGLVHDESLIRVSGGSSATISLASSMLASGRKRIAVVLDAGVTAPEEVARKREFIEAALQQYAIDSQFRLFLAVPTIERWLFLDPMVADQILPASEASLLKPRIDAEPRAVLSELLETTGHPSNYATRLKERLSEVDLTPITKHRPVSELVEYVLGKWAMKPVA